MGAMTLLDDTLTRLARARGRGASLRSIAAEPAVPYDWLKKFAGGHIPDPSVNRVQALNERLRALGRRARD